MDFGSVEGVVITLLLLVPGGLGDVLMRSITGLGAPTSNFRQLLSAVAWSISGLGAVETVNSFISQGEFGGFLLEPITRISSGAQEAELAVRYLVYVSVVVVLPPLARAAARRAMRAASRATLAGPSFDRLIDYGPKTSEGHRFAEIETERGAVSGWVLWSTRGEVEDAAVILRSHENQGVTWVPARSIVWARISPP